MGVCSRCGQQATGSLCMACGGAQVQHPAVDGASPGWAATLESRALTERLPSTPTDHFFIDEVPRQSDAPASTPGAHTGEPHNRHTPRPEAYSDTTPVPANGWWPTPYPAPVPPGYAATVMTPPQLPVPPGYAATVMTPPQLPVPPGYAATVMTPPQLPVPPGYAATVMTPPQLPVPPGYAATVMTPPPVVGVPQPTGPYWPNQAPNFPVPPNTPPAGKSPRGWLVALVVLAVVLVAIAVVIAVIMASRLGAQPEASSTTAPTAVTTVTVPPTQSPTPTPTPTPTVDPEVAAQAELDRLIAESASWVPLDGQWAAMLGGKWVGITDPLQTNSKGSHTFGAADILAEHETLKARVAGADVVLLDSRTFGDNISHDGQPLYVTIGLGDFNDRDDVLAWCAAQFPELSGARLENQCTSSRLYR